MKTKALLTLSLLIALTASLCMAAPAGKTQQLTSSDQVPEGLAKSDWTSIRTAYEAWRHAFQPIAGGWQARNPGQQWTTKFDERGFVSEPKGGGWQWGLELKRYGFPGAERVISGVPEVKAEGQRLTYGWDTAVQEWWVNDKRGLEHGFTMHERPAAGSAAAAPLQLDLAVRGSLTPQIAADGLGVEFRDGAGDTVLTYSGLRVWDADGKILHSHFEPLDPRRPSLVTLSVDERGARYPLTIDPIAQQAYLKSGNNGSSGVGVGTSQAGDIFGGSVAVSGDTVVIGATREDSSTTGVNSTPNESATDAGAAYVFVRNGSTWSQQAYLKASNTGTNDNFGYSVAVAGDTVVVGARAEDSSTTGVNSTPNNSASGAGAAYVFVRSGTNWSQQAYLKASNTGVSDDFGQSVGVSGDTVVVGAYGEASSTTGVNSTPNESASNSGAAYVFVRSGTTWSQQAYLKASNTGTNDNFGYSVAVSGDTVVVGARYGYSTAGAAYVFVRSGTTWSQQAYLKASNTGESDDFGYSVAVAGDTVVVGAPHEDSSTTGVNSTPNNSASGAGAAYVFVRSGTNWSQQAYLKASNTGAYDRFGNSVSVSGDTVVVGAYGEASSTTGVNSTPNELAAYAGAAYVFVRTGSTWSQQAYLKASNTGAYDHFGCSVAVAGDTVVVGAYGEASSTTGVNSTPNESANGAGASYVFVRSGTHWSQQAYLKPSNAGVPDYFGYSVAVAGDTVVVGAYGEASSTTGVNSTPDESAAHAGAAYVFVRSGTTWSQQAYLKASNTGAYDRFGYSVAVSGDTVAVGAPYEDSSTTGVNSTPNESAGYSGAAYVFVRSGTTWSQQVYLKASNTGAGDQFGNSVSVSGDTVVVGAIGEASSTTGVNSTPDELAMNSGAAYVFVRSGTTWSQQAYLKPSNTQTYDDFGCSVSVSGDTVVVGAYGEDSGTTGVNSTPNNSASGAGAAYVFVWNGSTWSQQAYLKPSNTQTYDDFGCSVSVSGDTVVVGAYGEDSGTTGVNSTPNNSASGAGAAYVFVRNGSTWSQQAYLKAGNTGADDRFGNSVSVSGDTVVVGAYGEDSSTTGVNSTPYEGATDSGAAYVFVRNGSTWSQQAYLKAGNTGTSDQFGNSVAVSGATVVVGAYGEDSSTTGVNSTPYEGATDSGAAYIFTGLGPVVTESEIAVEQPTGTDLVDGTASRDFGSVAVGATNNLTFTISNSGNADLTGLGITIDGTDAAQFTVTANPTAPVSGPSGSTTFTVQFAPTSTGVKTAALHIANNDADENPFDINLAGAGVSPFALTGQARLSNGSFQFGFTNASGLPFTVLTSTNVELPLSNWTVLGAPIEAPPGQYQFTDPDATNNAQRFYLIRSP